MDALPPPCGGSASKSSKGPAHADQSVGTGAGACRGREAATARASSVRRMSRNATGTAASAVSPLTQNAH